MLGAARVLCALVVILLPWFYGGVTPGADAILLGGAGLAAACCGLARIGVDGRPAGPPAGGRAATIAFAGAWVALGVAALTLLPLPRGLVEAVSPASLAWRAPEPVGAPAWVPIALAPDATLAAWWRACACVVLAWTALQVTRRSQDALWLLGAVAVAGVAASAYALLGSLSGGALTFHSAIGASARASAPFVNPNHLATLSAMTLPLLITFWRWKWRDRQGAIRKRPALQIVLIGAMLCVVAALLASLSRGGILAAAVGGIVFWWAVRAPADREGEKPAWRRIAPVVAILALFALAFGVGPMLDRFVLIEQQGNTRSVGWAMAWAIGWDFPWLGAGLGAFGELSPAYQPATAPGWWDAAHCDWLDWWAATGVLGVIPLAVAAGGWLRSFSRVRRQRLRSTRRLAVGAAGAAVAAVAWHAVLDFPFQIGAIAAVTAVLAGVVPALVDQPTRMPGEESL